MKKCLVFIFLICLVVGSCFLITEKAFSQTPQERQSPGERQSSTYVKGMTAGRAQSLAGGVLGLASLIIGWKAKSRAAAGIGNKGRNGAFVALALGAMAMLLGILHLSRSQGAVFGSGSGKAGAIVALLLSVTGIILASRVLRLAKTR